MRNCFTNHPETVGETYFQHLISAFSFASRLFTAAAACLVHGLFPFLFTSTGSSAVKRLHADMIEARRRQASGTALFVRRLGESPDLQTDFRTAQPTSSRNERI
jgi:hypothetical protein